MTKLEYYSDGQLPVPGTATTYTLCLNASEFEPFDISGVTSALNDFDSAISDISESTNSINSEIKKLDDEWGTKYVSIDGKSLDMVRPEEIETEDFKKYTDSLEEEKEKCESLVDSINSGIERVKSYLEQLNSNKEKYEKLKEEAASLESNISNLTSKYNSEASKKNPNGNVLSSISGNIRKAKQELNQKNTEIKKYEAQKISEPNGQWVVN